MRARTHARIHHHRDQICHFPRPVAERAHFAVVLAQFAGVAAMLARVAVALGRAGALAIPGIRPRRRNIIVPRNARGVPLCGVAGTTRRECDLCHAVIVRPFRTCSITRRQKAGVRAHTEILYSTRASCSNFAIRMPCDIVSPCCTGRKCFLRTLPGRAIRNLLVQQCCTEFSHPLPPFAGRRGFAEQPDMGSASARSIRAIRIDLMRSGAIEQRANRG